MTSDPVARAAPDLVAGTPKRYPKGLKRRQEILDRTIEVFAAVGFEGASLRAIGDAIGVSHAALRRYFETREALFLAVLQEKDRQAMVEAQERHAGGLALAESLEDYASKVPGLMALRHSMVARALEPGGEVSRSFFIDRYDSLRHEATNTLAMARDAGFVRRDIPPDAAASVVVATLDGLSTQWLLDSRVDIHRGIVLLEELLAP